MAQQTCGEGRAMDRMNIDCDLLTGAPVWAVENEDGEVLLFQEGGSREIRGGDTALRRWADGDVQVVDIGMSERREAPWGPSGPTDVEGYPVTDVQTGEEVEFMCGPPTANGEVWTALDMVM